MIASDAWKLDSAAPELVESADLAATVNRALLTLTAREERAVRLRYFKGASYDEVGDEFGVTKERARQIIQKAMRKLKHPSRSGKLRAALYGDLSFRHYFDAEPKTPSEAQEMARQAEERERSRVYEAERERLLQQRALEMERRAQWQREQEEWLRVERAEREAKRSARRARYEELRVGAKHAPALGSGNIVRVLDKNINIGSSIRMEVGEIWDVGDSWCVTLINDGYVVSVL